MTTDVEAKRPDKRWFVIHTYSGYENKVKANLEHRIASMDEADKIFEVFVPKENEIEIKQAASGAPSEKKVSPATFWFRCSWTERAGTSFGTRRASTGFVAARASRVPVSL